MFAFENCDEFLVSFPLKAMNFYKNFLVYEQSRTMLGSISISFLLSALSIAEERETEEEIRKGRSGCCSDNDINKSFFNAFRLDGNLISNNGQIFVF